MRVGLYDENNRFVEEITLHITDNKEEWRFEKPIQGIPGQKLFIITDMGKRSVMPIEKSAILTKINVKEY